MARITEVSRQRISSCVASRETSSRASSASGGRPAPWAAACMTRTVSRMQRRADGWGLITTAFLALIAMSAL